MSVATLFIGSSSRLTSEIEALQSGFDELASGQMTLTKRLDGYDATALKLQRDVAGVNLSVNSRAIASQEITRRVARASQQLRTEYSSARHIQDGLGQKADATEVADLGTQVSAISADLAAAGSDLAMAQNKWATLADRNKYELNLVSSAPSQSSLPAPVYNAIFEPSGHDGTVKLKDKQSAAVRFFIGTPDAHNGIGFPARTVSSKILEQEGAIILTTTLYCSFCRSGGFESQTITFQPDSLSSSEAIFTIVPDRQLTRNHDGIGQIVFDVSSGAVEFDHIVVNVAVNEDSTSATEAAPATPLPTREVVSKPEKDGGADIIFRFVRPETTRLRVQVIIPNSELSRKLNWKSGPVGRVFDCGAIGSKEIQQQEHDAFVTLTGLMEKNSPENKKLLQAISSGKTMNLSPAAEIKLSDQDRQTIGQAFYRLGSNLHYVIFGSGESELSSFMESFNKVDSIGSPARALRIRIDADDVYVPWQLLHPGQGLNFDKFWGLRYEMAINIWSHEDNGPLPGNLHVPNPATLIFATYQSASPDDDVTRLSNDEATFAAQKLAAMSFLRVKSRQQLLDAVKTNNLSLMLLLAYTHAASAWFVKTENGVPELRQDARGSRLILSSEATEYVTPPDVLHLATESSAKPFLPNHPIVLLNACQTGVPAGGDGDYPDVPESFLPNLFRLGAGGVIATESSVWDVFAFNFGNDLIEQLSHGVKISTALFMVRKNYMRYGVPLGLLYSYYGDIAATVVKNAKPN